MGDCVGSRGPDPPLPALPSRSLSPQQRKSLDIARAYMQLSSAHKLDKVSRWGGLVPLGPAVSGAQLAPPMGFGQSQPATLGRGRPVPAWPVADWTVPGQWLPGGCWPVPAWPVAALPGYLSLPMLWKDAQRGPTIISAALI